MALIGDLNHESCKSLALFGETKGFLAKEAFTVSKDRFLHTIFLKNEAKPAKNSEQCFAINLWIKKMRQI